MDVCKGLTGLALYFDVVVEVGHDEEAVNLQQVADDGCERVAIAVGKATAREAVDYLFEQGTVFVMGAGAIAVSLLVGNLLGGKAEKKEVFRTALIANLDVGAIKGSNGDGAVHHELHAARARGLFAGGRNLLVQVRGGVDALAKRN